jgi:hypothetical protein
MLIPLLGVFCYCFHKNAGAQNLSPIMREQIIFLLIQIMTYMAHVLQAREGCIC